MRNGTVIDIEAEMINVKVGEEVRHVAFHELELLPSEPLPQKQLRNSDDSNKQKAMTSGQKQHKNMTSPYGAGNGAPSQGFPVILVFPLVVIIKQIFT